jgi:hypothetical protein
MRAAASPARAIVSFGGFGYAATIVATVYVLGLAAAPSLPETRGKPLPI